MRIIAGFFIIAILVCAMVAVSSVQIRSFANTLPPSGILIPIYTPPDSSWDAIIQAKEANPNLSFIIIVNPANGPGDYQQSNFVQGVTSLESAGIIVLGYVYTNYGNRNITSIEADISAYKSWYNVNGILFDEMPNVIGYEGYFSTLNSYAKSIGIQYTAGNPGTAVPPSYLGILDLYVVDEGASPPTSSSGSGSSDLASVLYSVPTLTQAYIDAITQLTGYVYITDQAQPNPYAALPSYFTTLVSMLANIESSNQTGSSLMSTVTVESSTTSNVALPGLWTVVSLGGVLVASGFTPLSFPAIEGQTYSVSVVNYGNYVLDHWFNNATTNTVTITPTSNDTITAYYRQDNSVPVTVRAINQVGASIPGLWIQVMSNGQTVYSGFTPFVWQATVGQEYTVGVANYAGYTFCGWAGGRIANPITVTPSNAMTLNAIYLTPSQIGNLTTAESTCATSYFSESTQTVIQDTNTQPPAIIFTTEVSNPAISSVTTKNTSEITHHSGATSQPNGQGTLSESHGSFVWYALLMVGAVAISLEVAAVTPVLKAWPEKLSRLAAKLKRT